MPTSRRTGLASTPAQARTVGTAGRTAWRRHQHTSFMTGMRERQSQLDARLSDLDGMLDQLEAMADARDADVDADVETSHVVGLSPSALASLPVCDATEAACGEDDCCAICLDSISVGDKLMALACTHAFHASCVRRWLAVNPLCPLCKEHALEPSTTPPRARQPLPPPSPSPPLPDGWQEEQEEDATTSWPPTVWPERAPAEPSAEAAAVAPAASCDAPAPTAEEDDEEVALDGSSGAGCAFTIAAPRSPRSSPSTVSTCSASSSSSSSSSSTARAGGPTPSVPPRGRPAAAAHPRPTPPATRPAAAARATAALPSTLRRQPPAQSTNARAPPFRPPRTGAPAAPATSDAARVERARLRPKPSSAPAEPASKPRRGATGAFVQVVAHTFLDDVGVPMPVAVADHRAAAAAARAAAAAADGPRRASHAHGTARRATRTAAPTVAPVVLGIVPLARRGPMRGPDPGCTGGR